VGGGGGGNFKNVVCEGSGKTLGSATKGSGNSTKAKGGKRIGYDMAWLQVRPAFSGSTVSWE